MKLYLKDQEIALRSPRIMGVIAVQPQESVLIDDLVNKAQEMKDSGADLIEIGIQSLTCIGAKEELNKLIPVVKAVSEKTSLIVAIATIYPEVMEEAVNVGAQLIIDHNALRSVGAIETVAKLKVPVCLVFDQDIDFESSSASDPRSGVSSFSYEPIDACLNAVID